MMPNTVKNSENKYNIWKAITSDGILKAYKFMKEVRIINMK